VRTPLGSLHTAALVLLALAFLLPSCAFIPKAALAAVLQTAVLSMIEFQMIVPMWRAKSKLASTEFMQRTLENTLLLFSQMHK
jgi:MFS superfamily sulfate permease-like transporter